MKIFLAALAAFIAVAAGGAVVAVPMVEKHAAQQIKEEIERDGLVSVEGVTVGLFDRRIEMANIRSRGVEGYSASVWSVSGLSWPLAEIVRGRVPLNGLKLGDPIKAARIEVRDFNLSDGNGNGWKFGQLLIEDVDLARYDPDIGAGLFVIGLVAALYWRLDSRWPFGLALALLVLIPLMQLAYQRNWLFWGQAIADGMAVSVWYLLVIGVSRQIAELRTAPAPLAAPVQAAANAKTAAPEAIYGLHSGLSATPAFAPAAAPAQRTPGEPIPFHRSLRKQRMVARRVLGKIERTRHGMDGIRPSGKARP